MQTLNLEKYYLFEEKYRVLTELMDQQVDALQLLSTECNVKLNKVLERSHELLANGGQDDVEFEDALEECKQALRGLD
jgi:hypothetical protein